jgi:hypothetical protein
MRTHGLPPLRTDTAHAAGTQGSPACSLANRAMPCHQLTRPTAARSGASACRRTRRSPPRCRPSSATSPSPAAPRPARAYLDDLLPDVLEGRIEPGRVLDRTVGLGDVPDGYRVMNDREAIMVMVMVIP